MSATQPTYAAFRVDPTFDFNNFSQENLVELPASPIQQSHSLRPALSDDGSVSYRLSSQSISSSSASSGGPVTPRQHTISMAFSTAPSTESSDLEPHAIMDDNASVYSNMAKPRTQTTHSRFARMSVWVGGPPETPVSATSSSPEIRPAYDERQSSLKLSQLTTSAPVVQAPQKEEEEIEEEIVESPQIYHVLELENDLIEDMVSLRLSKPVKPHKAETVVFTRPKTLTISSMSDLSRNSTSIPVSMAKISPMLRPKLNTAVTAPAVQTLSPSSPRRPCPVHGNKHKSTFLPISLPSSPVSGSHSPLPSPAIPSKLRSYQAVDSMRGSVAISIKSFDEIRRSRHFSSAPKPEQASKEINRKSMGRRKFSFEQTSEELTPPLPLMTAAKESKQAVTPAIVMSQSVEKVKTLKATKDVSQDGIKSINETTSSAATTPKPTPKIEKRPDSRQTSLESIKLDLTLTMPSEKKALPLKPPCPVHGHDHRPNSSWGTKPPVATATLTNITIPLRVSSQSGNQSATPLSPSSATPSLPFLQKDPFQSRPSIDSQRVRPKSSGGESTTSDFDKMWEKKRHSRAPSIISSKSARSIKSGMSKIKRMLTRKKTADI